MKYFDGFWDQIAAGLLKIGTLSDAWNEQHSVGVLSG